MTPDEILIEAVSSAWRPDDPGQPGSHPNWHDLDEDGRRVVFDVTRRLRAMEAALDDRGLSTTARAVLARIHG